MDLNVIDLNAAIFRRIGRGFLTVGLLAAIVVATAISGCGDDSDEVPDQEPSTPNAAAPTATVAAAPTATITLQEPNATATFAPLPTIARNSNNLELRGIPDDAWLNSAPTTIAELTAAGKVVLIDFWTYTCVNCLRTLPFLREWHEKYSDRGLVILGIHAPEFEFEKEISNVQMAIEDEMVPWPVALDNNMATWNAFRNRYWPAKYLIGSDHNLLYSHFGEGAYRETELEIRNALTAAGHDISDIPVGQVENVTRDTTANKVTRELYGGYHRSYSVYGAYAANDDYYAAPDREVEYVDTYKARGQYPEQQYVLQGLWRNEAEAIVHARQTNDLSDYIALNFIGRSANVVIDPPDAQVFQVFVELDGRPLTAEEFGDDIETDDQGRTFFTVDEGRMYRIVEVPEFNSYVLKLSSDSDNFAIFAFTFGVYDGGF